MIILVEICVTILVDVEICLTIFATIPIPGVTMMEVGSLRGENSAKSALGLASPRFFIPMIILMIIPMAI